MTKLDINKFLLADIHASLERILLSSDTTSDDKQVYQKIKERMTGLDTNTLFIIRGMVEDQLKNSLDDTVVTADVDVKEQANDELNAEDPSATNPEEAPVTDTPDEMAMPDEMAGEEMPDEEVSSPVIDKITELEDYTDDILHLIENAMNNIFDMDVVNELVDIKIFVNDKLGEITKGGNTDSPEELLKQLDDFKNSLDGYKEKIEKIAGESSEQVEVPEEGNIDSGVENSTAEDAQIEKVDPAIESSKVLESTVVIKEYDNKDTNEKEYFVVDEPDENQDPSEWKVYLKTTDKNEAEKFLQENQNGVPEGEEQQLVEVEGSENVEEDSDDNLEPIVGTEEEFSEIESEEKFDDGEVGEDYTEDSENMDGSEFEETPDETSLGMSDGEDGESDVSEQNFSAMLKNLTEVTAKIDEIKDQVIEQVPADEITTNLDEIQSEVQEVAETIEDKPSTNVEDELEDPEGLEKDPEVTEDDVSEKVDDIEAALSSVIECPDDEDEVKRIESEKGMPKLNKKSVEILQ